MAAGANKEEAAPAASLPEKAAAPVAWVGGALSTLLILFLFGLTIYAIVMRYLVEKPVLWIDELTGYLLVALIMLGVTEAYRRRDHISIDILTGGLTGRRRLIKGVWSDLCVIGFAVVLGVSTWEAIEFARMFGSYSSGEIEIETWIPQVPMLVGAALLGAFALARLAGRFLKR